MNDVIECKQEVQTPWCLCLIVCTLFYIKLSVYYILPRGNSIACSKKVLGCLFVFAAQPTARTNCLSSCRTFLGHTRASLVPDPQGGVWGRDYTRAERKDVGIIIRCTQILGIYKLAHAQSVCTRPISPRREGPGDEAKKLRS